MGTSQEENGDKRSHYGDPKKGCRKDEVAVSLPGVAGSFCSRVCWHGSCPTDVPSGVTAKPTCIKAKAEGLWRWRCALGCSRGQCGQAAHCRKNAGVRTYVNASSVVDGNAALESSQV